MAVGDTNGNAQWQSMMVLLASLSKTAQYTGKFMKNCFAMGPIGKCILNMTKATQRTANVFEEGLQAHTYCGLFNSDISGYNDDKCRRNLGTIFSKGSGAYFFYMEAINTCFASPAPAAPVEEEAVEEEPMDEEYGDEYGEEI